MLSENNLIMYVTLQEAIIEELEYENLKTFPYSTNIYTTCDVSPTIEVTTLTYK